MGLDVKDLGSQKTSLPLCELCFCPRQWSCLLRPPHALAPWWLCQSEASLCPKWRLELVCTPVSGAWDSFIFSTKIKGTSLKATGVLDASILFSSEWQEHPCHSHWSDKLLCRETQMTVHTACGLVIQGSQCSQWCDPCSDHHLFDDDNLFHRTVFVPCDSERGCFWNSVMRRFLYWANAPASRWQ